MRAGVVLAGGRSRRMGRPKGELTLGGVTFLERVVTALAPAVDRLFVVAAADQPRSRDRRPTAPDRRGPPAPTPGAEAGGLTPPSREDAHRPAGRGDDSAAAPRVEIIRDREPLLALAIGLATTARVEIIRDRLPDRGPLHGLAIGLAAAQQAGCDRAFVAPCDTPLLATSLVRAMLDALDAELAEPARLAGRGDGQAGSLVSRSAQEWDAIVAQLGGRWHPLGAVYRTALAESAEAELAAGRASLIGFLGRLTVRTLREEKLRPFDPDLASFVNVNDPAALAELERRFGP